jgi:hypothetical protein
MNQTRSKKKEEEIKLEFKNGALGVIIDSVYVPKGNIKIKLLSNGKFLISIINGKQIEYYNQSCFRFEHKKYYDCFEEWGFILINKINIVDNFSLKYYFDFPNGFNISYEEAIDNVRKKVNDYEKEIIEKEKLHAQIEHDYNTEIIKISLFQKIKSWFIDPK